MGTAVGSYFKSPEGKQFQKKDFAFQIDINENSMQRLGKTKKKDLLLIDLWWFNRDEYWGLGKATDWASVVI